MHTVHSSLANSLGLFVHQYLKQAKDEDNCFKIHLIGRILNLGTAIVGIAEAIVRLALYCFARLSALCIPYQPEKFNLFLTTQYEAGLAAAGISIASVVGLVNPLFWIRAQRSADASVDQSSLIRRRDALADEVRNLRAQNNAGNR